MAVEWRLEDENLHIDVDIPPTATATVSLPDGRRLEAGPGRFQATARNVPS
ncbi:alpha-L-rhamnosidase C-terminal domain-containing protein [Streptomyces sp. MCAF7]